MQFLVNLKYKNFSVIFIKNFKAADHAQFAQQKHCRFELRLQIDSSFFS